MLSFKKKNCASRSMKHVCAYKQITWKFRLACVARRFRRMDKKKQAKKKLRAQGNVRLEAKLVCGPVVEWSILLMALNSSLIQLAFASVLVQLTHCEFAPHLCCLIDIRLGG